jgi:orotidine-5'-phosphate decarboxylase
MKLCIALDLETKEQNLALLHTLKNFDDIWIKVGFRSYIRDGREFLNQIKDINPKFNIFLDLKLYDIPNTMADAAEEIANLGVQMFNVHASAGKVAMQTVMQRLEKFPNRPLVLAVTALTSFDETNFKHIYKTDIKTKAAEFAQDTFEAGLDGVVCSTFESQLIKNTTKDTFLTLCPGIRPFGEDSNDQQRVADIKTAKKEAVDFAVVGRPIYKASDPVKIVAQILEDL